jgi:peptide/nickel transport system ATP-binding protein
MGVLLSVKNLQRYFNTSRGILHAVENVSFDIEERTTLGIVGESGCGKSTLGRTILGLIEPTDGDIYFEGKNISRLSASERLPYRRQMQIVFQDPYSSLDPRMSVHDLIAEPLCIAGINKNSADRVAHVRKLMDTVGLATRIEHAYPHELDGGRRQRIGIARALALTPKFIVCDEPVSALDMSIQAQILNLLQDLQESLGLTYVFITHDLAVVKHISDNILIMYMGSVVEQAPVDELFKNPLHPYTHGLFSAIPVPRLRERPQRFILKGEVSKPDGKPGCKFAPRCPKASVECFSITPELRDMGENHMLACHHAER